MNQADRYERGDRLIKDATFIKNNLIPQGLGAGRWNIVVFEAYRVVELYIKALFFFSGYSPRESHELDVIIEDLCALIEREKRNLPFIYSLSATGGDCYGIKFIGNNLKLYKRIANIYTLLGSAQLSSISADEMVQIKIEVDGPNLQVFLSNEAIFCNFHSSLSEPLKLSRTLVRPPNKECIVKMKSLVLMLRETREKAFYSERLFSKQDSNAAIKRMSEVINLSKSFLVHEQLT